MGDFKDLKVWQLSRRVTNGVYDVTDGFPGSERFGMTSQVRRAVVSVATNLAEGNSRASPRDQAQFFRIALGSAREVECLVILAGDRRFATPEGVEGLVTQVQELQRMIVGLLRYCARRES